MIIISDRAAVTNFFILKYKKGDSFASLRILFIILHYHFQSVRRLPFFSLKELLSPKLQQQVPYQQVQICCYVIITSLHFFGSYSLWCGCRCRCRCCFYICTNQAVKHLERWWLTTSCTVGYFKFDIFRSCPRFIYRRSFFWN